MVISKENRVNPHAAVDDIYNSYGKIDALVNCAGIFSSSKPFYEMTIEEWDRVISTNFTGAFLCSKHVPRRMIENKKGKIVNISCIRSRIFRPNNRRSRWTIGNI